MFHYTLYVGNQLVGISVYITFFLKVIIDD